MIVTIESFSIVGISVRTSNEPGNAEHDIPQLWSKFLAEQVIDQIPDKISRDIYSVYTNYEKDFKAPYTTILGCRVKNNSTVSDRFTKKTIPAGQYQLYTTKGKLADGIIFKEWTNIWNSSVKRLYTADFEVYGEKAQDPLNAEVDIFVAVE